LVLGLVLAGLVLCTVLPACSPSDGSQSIEGAAKLQKSSLPSETNNLMSSISRFVPGTDVLDVQGWAFIEGQSAENSQIYLVLRSDSDTYVFDTVRKLRPDVTAAFAQLNLNLDDSGFTALIPTRDIRAGEYTVGVLLRKGDIEALRYLDRAVVKSEHGMAETLRTSESQTIQLPVESHNMRLGISPVQEVRQGDEPLVEITGWAFIKGQSAQNSRIYVVLRGPNSIYTFDTILQKRPDVTSSFKSLGLDLDNSGFIARIPKGKVEQAYYLVGIYITNDMTAGLQYSTIRTSLW